MTPTHPGPADRHPGYHPTSGVGDKDYDADTKIEQRVRWLLAEMPASETAHITVAARNGLVTLDGTVSDSPWLDRFKSRVTSAMPGITVDDRLEWVLPDCGVGRA